MSGFTGLIGLKGPQKDRRGGLAKRLEREQVAPLYNRRCDNLCGIERIGAVGDQFRVQAGGVFANRFEGIHDVRGSEEGAAGLQ